jgi:hypothetical protein
MEYISATLFFSRDDLHSFCSRSCSLSKLRNVKLLPFAQLILYLILRRSESSDSVSVAPSMIFRQQYFCNPRSATLLKTQLLSHHITSHGIWREKNRGRNASSPFPFSSSVHEHAPSNSSCPFHIIDFLSTSFPAAHSYFISSHLLLSSPLNRPTQPPAPQ